MPTDLGPVLLGQARAAIAKALGIATAAAPEAPALHEPGAVFVTLTKNGGLRGCIGSLEPHRALGDDVRANAIAAAFRDPRFPPLGDDEWPELDVEVSLIGDTEWRTCATEADAIAWLRPHQDGVILEHGGCRATFLPQVWDALPDATRFLAELRRKAGMRADRWPESMRVGRYPVEKYREP